jgi:hypothetical protein
LSHISLRFVTLVVIWGSGRITGIDLPSRMPWWSRNDPAFFTMTIHTYIAIQLGQSDTVMLPAWHGWWERVGTSGILNLPMFMDIVNNGYIYTYHGKMFK